MADPRSIHEFTTGQVEATTLLLGDFVDLDAQSGYTTYKMSVSDLGEVILEDIEYTQDLQTVDKTIIGSINENKSVIGYSYDEYDATTAYSKDDLCIYNNTLYKALQATTGNLPTNTTYWEQTSIADEINELKSNTYLYSAQEYPHNGVNIRVIEYFNEYIVVVGGTATSTDNDAYTILDISSKCENQYNMQGALTAYSDTTNKGYILFNEGKIKIKVTQTGYLMGWLVIPKFIGSRIT